MFLRGMVFQTDRSNFELSLLALSLRSSFTFAKKHDRILFEALDFEMSEVLSSFVNLFERLPICFLGR